jgi:SAM-dependent methyltransferase
MTDYMLDNAWQQARQRLTALEAWLDPGTIRHLETLGVAAGWRCWEAGAGGGSIAAWLSRRVDASGSVLATDIDTRFLEIGAAPNIAVRRHNLGVEPLPEGGFDLVHARAVLEHLPQHAPALAQLTTALKPGGWLLIEELDFASFVPGSSGDAADAALFHRVWAAAEQVGAARGSRADYGRQLFGAVAGQGLVELGAEGRVAVANGTSASGQLWRLTTQQVRGAIVATGLVADDDLERYLTLLATPAFVWLMPTMVAVWGRRPTVSVAPPPDRGPP